MEIVSRAKVTDMISSVAISHGYIINDKLMSIIKMYNLPNHKFYPGKLHTGISTIDYYWFHFITNGFWDWIDKKKSKLSLRSIIPDQRDKLLAEVDLHKPYTEILSVTSNMPKLTKYYWDKIVLTENFPKYDIFSTPSPSYHTIISQRLLDAFKEEGITGYEVKDFCAVETI